MNKIAYFLVMVGVVTRLIPHVPNFTSMGAVALFGGLYLSGWRSYWVPLMALLLSDLILGIYDWRIMVSVYLGLLFMVWCGVRIRRYRTVELTAVVVLLGSIFFFLISNFAVWLWSGMYSLDWIGLIECYYLALPFFKNTLLGNLFYSVVLIGGYELIKGCLDQWAYD